METALKNISHNKEESKFYTIKEDYEAYLEYRLRGTSMIEFYFIFTPVPIRGGKLASDITKAALEYAEKENLIVIPSCSFVDQYMERNEKFKRMRSMDYERIAKEYR